MYPFYVAVQDGDDYRHLVEHITCDEDLMNFQEHVAELILGATLWFVPFLTRHTLSTKRRSLMDTYTNDQDQYMSRMNQTARSKFDLLQPYLAPGISILNFGSGYSPEFIDAVLATGASYTACDHSSIVQEKLQAHGVNWLTPQT